MHKHNRGFTLVELLLVISVIAILATLGVVLYSGAQQRATSAAVLSDTQGIQGLLEKDYSQHSSYPPEISGINAHPSVESAVRYFTNAAPFPVYANLTSDQNAQLLLKICNEVADYEEYDDYIDLCMLAGANINVKGDSCTATLHGPINNESEMQLQKVNCNNVDDGTLSSATDEIRQKFTAQGGTYPVYIPHGNKNQPALPEPQTIQSRASAYCLELQSVQYLAIIWSVTSENLDIQQEPCDTTQLPPLEERLEP